MRRQRRARILATIGPASSTPERIREMVDTDVEVVTHEELKAQLAECAFVIRTGETTAYANVIFKSGVAF